MARYGENIRKRADGRWEARYKVYDRGKGRNIYRSVYGATYCEAKEKKFLAMQAIRQQEEEKSICGDGRTGINREGCCKAVLFSQAAEEWLGTIADKCKHSTYVKYRNICKVHLEEPLNSCLLSDIPSQEIQEKIFDHISCACLSESLCRSICCVVGQILAYAVQKYSVCVPALRLPAAKSQKSQVEIFSETEQAKLLSCACDNPDKYKSAILLCLYTGLRLGELCALKWSDVDLEAMTLSVNRTVQRIAAGRQTNRTLLMETAPKSLSSVRVIPLTAEAVGILCRCDSRKPYIFGGEKPLEPRTMQYRFRKILKEAGIDSRRFHILRHTFATNCIENSMDVKALSEILGHSDVKITLNRYVHPTMDSKRRQIDRLSGFYGKIHGQAA